MCDKTNYKETTGFIALAKDYFKIETDPTLIGACQARALAFITEVERKAYDFLEYSTDFNQAGKEAATKSLKNITMIFHPRVNTFLNTYAYSSAQNVGYIELRQKLGKLIVKKLPN